MENFDAVGRWRTTDGGAPIDAAGTLPDGQSFKGPIELIKVLKSKKQMFVRNLAEKLLTFALGRGLEPYDKCALDEIVKVAASRGYRFGELATAIVHSEPFRKLRGEGPMQKTALAR